MSIQKPLEDYETTLSLQGFLKRREHVFALLAPECNQDPLGRIEDS